jgi:hypothetical protein
MKQTEMNKGCDEVFQFKTHEIIDSYEKEFVP